MLRYVRIPGIKVTRSSRTATASLARLPDAMSFVLSYNWAINDDGNWATFGLLFTSVWRRDFQKKTDNPDRIPFHFSSVPRIAFPWDVGREGCGV